ncbi:hypothetical protein [Aliarcobacter cryaerophilus]|uniref:hypothetical protein n=1 Tax=Aliarcobacter cryaerophilus TaxID=28198 RepID=UPI0021B194E7|nr:hypothetical protein [Aliarcobacter cryaerophilus]MCT7445516.1 hypothetical protein [Aliarcobacter cryaerophilus]MCT7480420.1 hypothetical protein [Aliarcobacter cryaerophilus]
MEIKEIAELIQREFDYVNRPKDDEVRKILSKINQNTTEKEFKLIVIENVADTLAYCNESADMSDTVSLLKQLQAMLKNR